MCGGDIMVLLLSAGNAMSSDDITQLSSEESSVLRAQGEKLSCPASVPLHLSRRCDASHAAPTDPAPDLRQQTDRAFMLHLHSVYIH